MKHICIYCKQEKEESEFNTEHVIPQQFGKYNTNAPVLNRFQVCRACNTAFHMNWRILLEWILLKQSVGFN